MYLADEKKKSFCRQEPNTTTVLRQQESATLVITLATVPCDLPIFVRRARCDRLSARTSLNQSGNFTPEPREPPPLAGAYYGSGSGRRQVGSAASRVPPRHSGLLCVPPHCSICIVWVNSFVCVCPWRDQGRVGNKTNFPPPAAPHCLHLIRHIWMDITDNNALYWPQ